VDKPKSGQCKTIAEARCDHTCPQSSGNGPRLRRNGKDMSRWLSVGKNATLGILGDFVKTENMNEDSDPHVSGGVCIVCGSVMVLAFWRGHPCNQRVHCNECGSEVTPLMHAKKQPNDKLRHRRYERTDEN
jgi:hypothetical protein